METEIDYEGEKGMWSDLVDILETDNVDFVVLNRARPDLVYSVLKSGIPLTMKDRKLYFDLLCKTSYEAMDWWDFVFDFWKIGEKSKSVSSEAKSRIIERLKFLEREFGELEEIKKFAWEDYRENSFKRKIIERWVENLVIPAIDIAQIILASEKREIPESYKDTLKLFWAVYINGNEKIAEEFSEFTKMRNIVAYEYLDVKWKQIQNFIRKTEKLYPKFIKKIKNLIK